MLGRDGGCRAGYLVGALVLLVSLVAVAATLGCDGERYGKYREGDTVDFGNGYELTLGPGWRGLEETAGDAELDQEYSTLGLYGPDGERADVWCSTPEEAADHPAIQERLIERGDVDGEVLATTLWGSEAVVMLGVWDESTGEHMLEAYLLGAEQPMGLRAYGFAEMEAMIARGATAQDVLEFVVDEIGLGLSGR